MSVAVEIHRPAEVVDHALALQRHADTSTVGEIFEIEECRLHAVGGNLHPRKDFFSAEGRIKVIRIENDGIPERQGKADNRLPRQGHPGFSEFRRGAGRSQQRNGIDSIALKNDLDQFVDVLPV